MKKQSVLFFVASLLVCCSDSGTSSSNSNEFSIRSDNNHAGMMRVNATNASVKMGPKQTVKFTYDFSLDKHEVTCGDFTKFIKKIKCDNPELPVTNVTFFDAVLFANEKSKNDKLDTAYSYTAATFDSEGHCTDLAGYTFNAQNDAYRLPTEAEWTLVASKNWVPQKGWNADNSDYKLHKPCTAESQSDFCDLAGNAMEWVNDWMGVLHDTTITNYAGAPDGGNVGERVVKGGSYRNEAAATLLDNRGDVYTVTSSTKANYVGFRLAFGKIPDAVWMNAKGIATASPINVLTTSALLKKSTKTYQNKLVFRNDETGNIAFVNFANGTPTVKEIEDSVDAYHPTLSPNGNLVAFSTKYEGISGNSSLYVQRLDSIEADKIKLDVESAAIPRWRVVGADTEIVYVSSTENNSDETAWKKEATWSVPFAGGKFGKPRKILDGTFNGGISTDEKFAVSGARLLRAHINDKNEIWYNKEQACNASFSELTKQTLFLDFGGNTGKEFSGHKYTTHEQLLIADSTGKLIKMIPAPKGYTFDHTEWVHNSENLAVATLTNINGEHPKIVLVNTNDSSITEIANGTELWHPDFWIGKLQNFETSLDVDSAGQYELNCPYSGDMSTTMTRYDLELLYKHRDSINVLISGSSRPWAGINPIILNKNKNIFSINMSNAAVDLSVARRIFFGYGANLLPKFKVAVISLDLDILFWRHYEMPSFWDLIFVHSPGFVYDESHKFWPEGYPKGLYELTRDSYGENSEIRETEQEMLGHVEGPGEGWQGSPIYVDSTYMDIANKHPTDMLLEEVEAFIQEAKEHNIFIIGVIFPQSPGYKETGAFGRYGLRRSVAKEMIEKIQKYEEKYSNFKLMDENKMGNHDYEDIDALNCDHLSDTGAKKLTNRLDSLIKALKIDLK
ncbi:TIGR02171 family protein [Fibrobacter sp. UWB11]|uniref:TIGR02171 family lipoprotein n=1 Tax=Fibrobacter sp. UWB11 TaxID=1896202 RepID=UPI00092A9469|nr:TIGR02171 family protein [Fibrobacter sp. UWB11]SIN82975.1 TIGR02171 family protein [Fibrobacter sp. UWB11]